MGSLSIWHWLIVLIVVMLLFGGKKVSTLMGDVAKGIKDFKKNMAEEDSSSKGSDSQEKKTLTAEQKDESVSFNESEKTTVTSDVDKK